MLSRTAATADRRLTPSGHSLVKVMLFAAVGLGSANALLAGCIPVYGAAAFTPHAGVALMLKAAAPWMATCLAFHALSTTLEGPALRELRRGLLEAPLPGQQFGGLRRFPRA